MVAPLQRESPIHSYPHMRWILYTGTHTDQATARVTPSAVQQRTPLPRKDLYSGGGSAVHSCHDALPRTWRGSPDKQRTRLRSAASGEPTAISRTFGFRFAFA